MESNHRTWLRRPLLYPLSYRCMYKSNEDYCTSFLEEEQEKNEKNLKKYEDVSFLLIFFYVFVIMYMCIKRHGVV